MVLIRWWSECASPIISFLISSLCSLWAFQTPTSREHFNRACNQFPIRRSYQPAPSWYHSLHLTSPCSLFQMLDTLYFPITCYTLSPLCISAFLHVFLYFRITPYPPHSPLIFWFFVFRIFLLLLTHPLPSPDNKCAAPAGATVSQPTTEFTRLGKIPPNAHNWGRNNMSQDHKEKVSAVLDNLGKGCYLGDLGGVWK